MVTSLGQIAIGTLNPPPSFPAVPPHPAAPPALPTPLCSLRIAAIFLSSSRTRRSCPSHITTSLRSSASIVCSRYCIMFRLVLASAAGIAALTQFAEGSSLRSDNGVALKGGGSRTLQDVLYCNSIGCPDSFTPIPDAHEVECADDPCEVSQCCEAFCSGYACPDSLTPIEDASSTLCTDQVCTTEQCCEAFCSYHPCPDGYIPIEDAGTTLCTDDICTDSQCCVSGDSNGEPGGEVPTDDEPAEGVLYCNSIGCPDSFLPIPDAHEVECADDPCEVSQCCEAFCSGYACPDSLTPIEDASSTLCTDQVCTTEQCCEAFCSYHPCPDGYIPIEDAGTTLCTDDICTDSQCCVDNM